MRRIMYRVPRPAVMPRAKVVKETLRLLVVIWLEATGLMVTMDSVHMRC